MSQSSQQEIKIPDNLNQQQDQTVYQQIPILYLWFGKTVPQDYLITLSQLSYPVIFLKNPKIQRKFSRQLFDVQKADYYRLWYLYQHGGIYSDFDNTIDYPCLMKLLQPYKNQDKLIFMTDGRHTREKSKQITINLIYAPYPKMPILQKMLNSIDQSKVAVWQFAGTKFVGQFEQPIEMQMYQCVKHSYDWSWYQASNKVLGLAAQAHPHFKKKTQKKSQIIAQKQKIQAKLSEQKSYNKYLQADLKRSKHQKAQYKSNVQQLNKKIISQCPIVKQMITTFEENNNKTSPVSYFSKYQHQQQKEQQNKQKQVVYARQRIQLWKKIKQMQEQNQKLDYQNKIHQFQIYGAIVLILVVLIFTIFKAFRKANSSFNKIRNSQNISSQLEQ